VTAAEAGHLVLRVGVGAMMVAHGWPKVAGGPARWEKLGHATEALGVAFAPTFWGAAAAFSETVGGALLALGLATRPAAALLVATMLVASANHLAKGDGVMGASHAIELGVVFVALLLMGGGRYSLDRRFGLKL
jgi:putative oxidoreductase